MSIIMGGILFLLVGIPLIIVFTEISLKLGMSPLARVAGSIAIGAISATWIMNTIYGL